MSRRRSLVPEAGVTLREYTDMVILHERELREARETSTALAIQVQSAGMAQQQTANYVTHTSLESRLTPLERQANRWSGGQTAILAAVALGGTVVGIILGLNRF